MNEKKKDKRLAHATSVWEREQIQAAMAAEAIDKAVAVIMEHKDELTDEQLEEVLAQTRVKKAEIEDFLLKARNKYAAKLDELNLEAVIHSDEIPKLVNVGDLL